MRASFLGMALLLLSTPALAQMGGGGMGGGGMGGGGMGGPPGGMGEGGPPGGGRPRPAEAKPIKREKLDKPVQAMFAAADTDRDGLVTLDELKAVLVERRDAIIRARFDRIDANRDRVIDQKEFVAWQTGLGSVAASDDQAAGDRGGPVAETLAPVLDDNAEGRMLAHIIEPLSATLIANANSNYDRGLSLDELLAHERKRFDDADTDKDGYLTAEEMRALMPRRAARGPGGPEGLPAPQGDRMPGPPPGQ
ncbi:MAG: EF-hand domain-containing protein [Sphingobium sp.]